MRLSAICWLLLPLLAHAPVASSTELAGTVVSIADGDTLTLLVDQRQVKVRLTEIDAPERQQPFGTKSRDSLGELCRRKPARVVTSADRDGFTLGRVYCAGVDANAEQVKRGMAWVYDKYVTDRSLYALQDAAKASHAGLWSDAVPISPWEYREAVIAHRRTK